MKYYAERNGLLNNDFNISLKDLRLYFFKTYQYLENLNYFEAAISGIWIDDGWNDSYQKIPPLLAPSPEVFFAKHLSSSRIYPIHEYYEHYTEGELFTVIEIMYNNASLYDDNTGKLKTEDAKKDFAMHINSILRFYKDGYFLQTNDGFVSKNVNKPLKMMLSEDLSTLLSEDVIEKMKTAVKMYYRFDSNIELKKKAITILYDILEPLREDLKDILNLKYEVNKNIHDKLIFDIVNNFKIRHNTENQKTQYEVEIWLDWMMQYYSSIIITYYKLKSI